MTDKLTTVSINGWTMLDGRPIEFQPLTALLYHADFLGNVFRDFAEFRDSELVEVLDVADQYVDDLLSWCLPTRRGMVALRDCTYSEVAAARDALVELHDHLSSLPVGALSGLMDAIERDAAAEAEEAPHH